MNFHRLLLNTTLLFSVSSMTANVVPIFRVIPKQPWGHILVYRVVGCSKNKPFCYNSRCQLEDWLTKELAILRNLYEKDQEKLRSHPNMAAFYEEKHNARVERVLDKYEAALEKLKSNNPNPKGL